MSAQAERIQTGRLREDPVSKLLLQFSFPEKMFPHAAILKRIALLGTPQFFLQLAGGITLLVLNTMLLKYGKASEYGSTIPISAMGIVMSVQSLMVMPVQGITQGAQPIIGYNFGARLIPPG